MITLWKTLKLFSMFTFQQESAVFLDINGMTAALHAQIYKNGIDDEIVSTIIVPV